MSDSTAAAAAVAAAPASASTPPPSSLVQAEVDDFVPGSELWVRGQRAVCVRFDYPHVYWQWETDLARAAECTDGSYEAPEKHRSCSATPHLFRVRAEAKRSAAHTAADHHAHAAGRTDSDDDEAHSDEAQRRADAFAEQQRQQQHDQHDQQEQQEQQESGAPSASPADSASDAVSAVSARLSLMSMFSQRPSKTIVGNLRDAGEETISISAPQSASIEKCVRTRFSVPNKISQLTLLECEDVEVDFRGVISTVELIRCSRCTLRCLQACPTFTIDDSSDCVIQFPGVQERVMVVSNLNSARTVLLAQPGGGAALPAPGSAAADESDEKQPIDIETEVRFVIGENPVEVEDTPAPEPSEPAAVSIAADADEQSPSPDAPASSSAPKQLQTVWKDGAFSTHTLVRQGPLGYFSN